MFKPKCYNSTPVYCRFRNFRENFIFVSDVKNSRLRQDLPISINERVILPFHEGLIFTKLPICENFRIYSSGTIIVHLFVKFDLIPPCQQFFSYVGIGLPGLNKARINVSCSRTQHSAAGEARTRNPLIWSQALYH